MKNYQKNMKMKYSEQKTMKINSEEKTGHKTKNHALHRLLKEEGDQEIKDYYENMANSRSTLLP